MQYCTVSFSKLGEFRKQWCNNPKLLCKLHVSRIKVLKFWSAGYSTSSIVGATWNQGTLVKRPKKLPAAQRIQEIIIKKDNVWLLSRIPIFPYCQWPGKISHFGFSPNLDCCSNPCLITYQVTWNIINQINQFISLFHNKIIQELHSNGITR